MPVETYHAWVALYLGVGITSALCAALSVVKTAYDYRSGAHRLPLATWPDRLLAAPKVWLRWQLNYLTGFPAIATIALMYADYIGFGLLGSV